MSSDVDEQVDGNSLATLGMLSGAPAPRWPIEKHAAAQLIALSGKTRKAVAKELGIPLSALSVWMQDPEYLEHINTVVLDSAKTMNAKLLQLKMKALAAREEEAEENGYSTFTNKDSLDLMAEIRKETQGEGSADNSYTSLLEKLVQNSMRQPKTIIVESV